MEVLRDRLPKRTGDIADATVDLLEAQQAAEPFTEAEQPYVKTLDTSQPLEPQLLRYSVLGVSSWGLSFIALILKAAYYLSSYV